MMKYEKFYNPCISCTIGILRWYTKSKIFSKVEPHIEKKSTIYTGKKQSIIAFHVYYSILRAHEIQDTDHPNRLLFKLLMNN